MKTPKNLQPLQLNKDCFSTRHYLLELKQRLQYFNESWKLFSETYHTFAFIDDILVTRTDEQNHLNNLELVLQRLESAGLTLKKSKRIFTATSVEYLGHVIDKNRLHSSLS